MIYILITNALILFVIFAILNHFKHLAEDFTCLMRDKDKDLTLGWEREKKLIKKSTELRYEADYLTTLNKALSVDDETACEVKCVECGFFKDVGHKTSRGGVIQFGCTYDECYDIVKASSSIYGTTSRRMRVKSHQDLNKDNKCKFFVDRSICE